MQEYKYYVGGEFRRGKEEIKVVNPATEEPFAKIFETTEEDLNFAIEKAKTAQEEWKRFSFKDRAKVLRNIASVILDNLAHLAQLETQEIGKPHKESLFVDIPLSAECFNYYASFLEAMEEKMTLADNGIDLIKYEPYGVCGVYVPYNVPLMIFGFSCAAALAAGNSLIIKPSEFGSLSLLELAKGLDKLDIPEGLINIITGKGASVGKYLSRSNIDIISFTGSRNTLQKIVSSMGDYPKKIICELGGANLTVVFNDADKNSAIENILGSSFMKQGQMCIGTSIVLIEDGIYDELLQELLRRVKSIKLGDPFDATVGMGPLVTREHLNSIDARIKDVLKRGGKLLTGGEAVEGKGYFYLPTVLEVKDIIYEEFFAPVLIAKSFKSAEIERLIKDNPTGLVLQVWTRDIARARKLADEASCGTVWVNTFAQMGPATPFGGMKSSGWGRNLGSDGFFEYAQAKHIGIGTSKSPVEGWFGV